MMNNQLPAELPKILDYLSSSHRYGVRNRCLYRLRLVLFYREITELQLGSVLSGDGTIFSRIAIGDFVLPVDEGLAADLLAYIKERYGRNDLINLVYVRGHERLFRTQKSESFSTGWLAQLFTRLDKAVNMRGD